MTWRRAAAGILRASVACVALAAAHGAEAASELKRNGGEVSAEHRAVLDRFRTDFPQSLIEAAVERTVADAAEDLRLMAPNQGTVLGRENAAVYYKAFVARFEVRELRRESVAVADFGGRIGELGRYTLRVVHRGSGAERAMAGKYLDLWAEVPGGGLRLVTQVWNQDRWEEFQEEFRFREVPAVKVALEAHVPVKGGISFELAALNRLHETAVVQHDGAVWSQFFADDAVLAPNFSPLCVGRAEIDAYVAAHSKELSTFEKLDIRNDRIDDLGLYVIEYASHVANWRRGEASGVNTGKNLRVLRREPSGSLKYFWQIGNYD